MTDIKINNLTTKTANLSNTDKLVGTDSDDSNASKNFTLEDIGGHVRPYVVVSQDDSGDYDGTTETAIQNAINSLTSGGEIFIKRGTYTISTKLQINSKNNIKIICENGTIISSSIGGIVLEIIGSSDISFEGAEFDFNSTASYIAIYNQTNSSTMENITFKNNIFKDSSYGILVRAYNTSSIIQNLNIIDNIFENITVYNLTFNFLEPISLLGIIQNVKVTGNIFSTTSTVDLSVIISGSQSGSSSQNNFLIDNNIFRNINNSDDTLCINLRRSGSNTEFIISNNIFKDIAVTGTHYAIGVASYNNDNITVSDNQFVNIGYDGTGNSESHAIFFSDDSDDIGSNSIISGNFIKNITTGGTGTNKYDCEGIYCKDKNTQIINNKLIDAGDGYPISCAGHEVQTDVFISGNQIIYENRTPELAGVRVIAKDVTIQNNTFINLGASAGCIRLLTVVTETMGYVVIKDNVFDTAAWGIGIVAGDNQNGDLCIVHDNYFKGIAGTELDLAGFTDTDIKNNRGITEDFIFNSDAGSGAFYVSANTFKTEALKFTVEDIHAKITYIQDVDGNVDHYVINDIDCASTGENGYFFRANTDNIIKLEANLITAYKPITPHTSTDAAAPNNSIYYSSTQSKLVYKDSGGTVNNLY